MKSTARPLEILLYGSWLVPSASGCCGDTTFFNRQEFVVETPELKAGGAFDLATKHYDSCSAFCGEQDELESLASCSAPRQLRTADGTTVWSIQCAGRWRQEGCPDAFSTW